MVDQETTKTEAMMQIKRNSIQISSCGSTDLKNGSPMMQIKRNFIQISSCGSTDLKNGSLDPGEGLISKI